jgi:catechol-2,3-dioxygenase
MDGLDDYFDYAMDLDEAGRAKLMARLREDDPALAARLHDALTHMVKNPDFLCQRKPAPRAEGERDRLLAATLQVGDVGRAVAWYTEHFCCDVVGQSEAVATLAFGDARLQLRRWGEDRPTVTIVSPDVATLGPSQRRSDGVRALQLTDPWGNAVEVVDRAPG